MIPLSFQSNMHTEPKTLFNPTSEPIEFRADGKLYIFAPGEHRAIDGFAAHIALDMSHTGLVVYVEGVEQAPLKSADESELDKLTWVELRTKGAKAGLYKAGMSRKELTQHLIDHEGKTE